MGFGMENKSGSTRIENLYYKCKISEPSTAGVSSQQSGNSPLEPDFEELQSEYEDERTGQRPFRHHANERDRDDANRDSGYGSWSEGSAAGMNHERHHSPVPGPDRGREQDRTPQHHGFYNRERRDTGERPRNDAGNREYATRRPHSEERGTYEPGRNRGGYGYASDGPHPFKPRDGDTYGRSRSPDHHPHAGSDPYRPPSVESDVYEREGVPDHHSYTGPHPYDPPYPESDADERQGIHNYYEYAYADPYRSPSPESDASGREGPPSIFTDQYHPPSPGIQYQGRHFARNRYDDGSQYCPPYHGPEGRPYESNDDPIYARPASPLMTPDTYGDQCWSNVSTGYGQSEDGPRDVHRQCRLNPIYVGGHRVCRHRKGHFCRKGSAKKRRR